MKLLYFAFYTASRCIREPCTNSLLNFKPRSFAEKVFPRRNLFLGVNNRQESTEEEKETKRDPTKDRSKVIPVETSIKYLQSKAYRETYGNNPVWVLYRRNFKGAFAPKKTRKTCIRRGEISAGNPCPICRDEYLVLDYKNLNLLKQFISPHNGEVLSYSKTGLCQKKHQELLVAIERAKDRGLITFDVPFRSYDYSEFTNKTTEN